MDSRSKPRDVNCDVITYKCSKPNISKTKRDTGLVSIDDL